MAASGWFGTLCHPSGPAGSARLTMQALCLRQRPPLAFRKKSCFSEGFSHRKARAGLPRPPLHPRLPLQKHRELRGFAAGSTGAGRSCRREPSLCPGVGRGGARGCRVPVDGRAWETGGRPVDSRRCRARCSAKNPKPGSVLMRPSLTRPVVHPFRASSRLGNWGYPREGDGSPRDKSPPGFWEREVRAL